MSSNRKVRPLYLAIAVEATGKIQRSIRNRLRLSISSIAGDVKIAGTGQKAIVVKTVFFSLTCIGKIGNVKVIVVSVTQ